MELLIFEEFSFAQVFIVEEFHQFWLDCENVFEKDASNVELSLF
jgi:hypothetical protein